MGVLVSRQTTPLSFSSGGFKGGGALGAQATPPKFCDIYDKASQRSIRGEREMFYFNDVFNTFYLRLYGRKEGNVLFNDALNTFYLLLYGVRHMVKTILIVRKET